VFNAFERTKDEATRAALDAARAATGQMRIALCAASEAYDEAALVLQSAESDELTEAAR